MACFLSVNHKSIHLRPFFATERRRNTDLPCLFTLFTISIVPISTIFGHCSVQMDLGFVQIFSKIFFLHRNVEIGACRRIAGIEAHAWARPCSRLCMCSRPCSRPCGCRTAHQRWNRERTGTEAEAANSSDSSITPSSHLPPLHAPPHAPSSPSGSYLSLPS